MRNYAFRELNERGVVLRYIFDLTISEVKVRFSKSKAPVVQVLRNRHVIVQKG